MQNDQIDEIIQCLPQGRTPFYYFKDKYALMLLSYFVESGKTIKAIKSSHYAGLLNKPLVKQVTSQLSATELTQNALQAIWPETYETYLLTLGRWGQRKSWEGYQISRPGGNLVLQLNFSNKHNHEYHRWIKPENNQRPFAGFCHPVSKQRLTLAWVRMDIDFETNEVLIEEMQNDWIRNVLRWKRLLQRNPNRPFKYPHCSYEELEQYIKHGLSSHLQLWDEAMLMAAIWFIKEELGIQRIFYHTFETGIRLKHIGWGNPPQSLYSDLPRKFCFQEYSEAPIFLQRCHHRKVCEALNHPANKWFLLE